MRGIALAAAGTGCLFSAAFASSSGAAAQNPPAPRQIESLLACRNLTENSARLACYDKEAGTLSQAISSKEVVVIDREGVRKTKRTLFGLALPRIGILDDNDSNETEITQVEGVIASVRNNPEGGYLFLLKDGAAWTQADDKPIALEPEAGDKVVVKKAALGSYMLSVQGQPGVRVKRIR